MASWWLVSHDALAQLSTIVAGSSGSFSTRTWPSGASTRSPGSPETAPVIVNDPSVMSMNASLPTSSSRSTRTVEGVGSGVGASDGGATDGDGLTTGGTTAGPRSN